MPRLDKKTKKSQNVLRIKEAGVESIEELVNKGAAALQNMEPELANTFFAKAIAIDSSNTSALDGMADALLQLGRQSEAYEVLIKSVSIDADNNPYKWLTIAQLQQGNDSLLSYNTGISYLKNKHEDLAQVGANEHELFRIRSQISEAYAGIAELYMTDLCYEEQAESNCEIAIVSSLEFNPSSLDGHQTMASLRLSQERFSEACSIMTEVFSQVMGRRHAVQSRGIIDELLDQSDETNESLRDLPTLEFCINTSKLLLECAKIEPTHVTKAIELLNNLLNDDDEIIEVWYILGFAFLSLNPPDNDSALYHFEHAHSMMIAILEQTGHDQFPYSEQLGLVLGHLQILGSSQAFSSSTESANVEAINDDNIRIDDDEEEEWSTEEEEDDR